MSTRQSVFLSRAVSLLVRVDLRVTVVTSVVVVRIVTVWCRSVRCCVQRERELRLVNFLQIGTGVKPVPVMRKSANCEAKPIRTDVFSVTKLVTEM